MKIIEIEYVTCSWCGDDQVFSGDLEADGKCKRCFVEDCSHKPEYIVREYQGSNNHRVRFMEMCIRCNAFREIRLYTREVNSVLENFLGSLHKLFVRYSGSKSVLSGPGVDLFARAAEARAT